MGTKPEADKGREVQTDKESNGSAVVNRLTKAQIEEMYKPILQQAEVDVLGAELQLEQQRAKRDAIEAKYQKDMENAKES